MPAADELIWLSAKPLLKLIMTTSCGFILAKRGLFGGVEAKGASQLLLNVFMPALLFSKIVPGFTAQNIATLGPLVLVAVIYQLYGLLIAWITRKLFWVPHRFRNGLLVAGACNNWGDMPMAVIMSLTASAPFSSGDSDVAVAYISIFILIGFVALFPLGGYRLVAKDFAGPEKDNSRVSVPARARNWWVTRRTRPETTSITDVESCDIQPSTEKSLEIQQDVSCTLTAHASLDPAEISNKTVPQSPSAHTRSESLPLSVDETPRPSGSKQLTFQSMVVAVWRFIVSFAIPPTISIIVGVVVAVVPALRGLFIPPSSDSQLHISTAPDGLPPLHVIFDTATFIGGGSIPLGLICLGSALARLEVPKPLKAAPLGAIASFSILKMVVGPIFGVLLVEALTHHTSLINPDDKVLRFVCIYLAGSPTATTQVYLTQIYSPDGSASHISTFLIPQYALMTVTLTALSAYALKILF